MKLKYLLFTFSITLYLCSCGSTGSESTESANEENMAENDSAKVEEKTKEVSKEDLRKPPKTERKFNDLARFLAGLDPEEGSAFAKYSENGGWKQYKQYAENTMKERNISPNSYITSIGILS